MVIDFIFEGVAEGVGYVVGSAIYDGGSSNRTSNWDEYQRKHANDIITLPRRGKKGGDTEYTTVEMAENGVWICDKCKHRNVGVEKCKGGFNCRRPYPAKAFPQLKEFFTRQKMKNQTR